jgi:GNAT superfamily N-acetyltransferase
MSKYLIKQMLEKFVTGRGRSLHLRYLQDSDFNRVIALRNRVLTSLDNAVYYRREPAEGAFIIQRFKLRGCTLGVFDGPELVALGCLSYGKYEDLCGPEFGCLAPPDKIAWMASALVRKEYRGMGFHQVLIRERIREAVSIGRPYLASMVSSLNHRSWLNLMHHGFQIRLIKKMYGRFDRFILFRPPHSNSVDSQSAEAVDSKNIERQLELVSAGYVEIDAHRVENSMLIRYYKGDNM